MPGCSPCTRAVANTNCKQNCQAPAVKITHACARPILAAKKCPPNHLCMATITGLPRPLFALDQSFRDNFTKCALAS